MLSDVYDFPKIVDALLYPISKSDFATTYWAQRAFYNKEAIDKRLLTFLDPRSDLSNQLNNPQALLTLESQLRTSSTKRLIKDQSDIITGLRKGETFQVRLLQTLLSPRHPLLILARELEAFLDHPLDSISLFVSPPNSQAIAKHFDRTEIFTLQLEGTKTWAIYTSTGQIQLEITAGDLLYVPAGTLHEVTSMSASSISIAIVFRAIRLESAIIEYVRQALSADTLAQQTLPIFKDSIKYEASIRSLIQKLQEIDKESLQKSARNFRLIHTKAAGIDLSDNWWQGDLTMDLEINPYCQFLFEIKNESATISLESGAKLIFPQFVTSLLASLLEEPTNNSSNENGPDTIFSIEEINLVVETLFSAGILRSAGQPKKQGSILSKLYRSSHPHPNRPPLQTSDITYFEPEGY
jgi:ribosomal protein L16 Arg81 hydroxylase